MKTFFKCDICGEYSQVREEIEACEAKGVPDPELFPPIGLIVGSQCGPGTTPSGVVKSPWCLIPCGSHLCQAGFVWVVQHVGSSSYDAHNYCVSFGIFRGSGGGDTFNFVDGKGYYEDTFRMGVDRYNPERGFRRWQDWPEAQDCPALYRAAIAVLNAGLKPTVNRNGQLVEIDIK